MPRSQHLSPPVARPVSVRSSRTALTALLVATALFASGGGEYPQTSVIRRDGIAVVLSDWVRAPLSSTTPDTYPPPIDFRKALNRVTVMRHEPGNAPAFMARTFVADLNRTLAILDVPTKTFTTYINFEEVFPKFVNRTSLGTGFVTFAFHPEYQYNGRLYTVHVEGPSRPGPTEPTNTSLPGLDLSGYTTTVSIDPPSGSVVRHAVLVEWSDADVHNATFEGTAREILRIGFNFSNHAVGDVLFNPVATSLDADYGNLYIAVGDGGAGTGDEDTQTVPQRLDALPGKILRITPDLDLRPGDALGVNGRYRVPTTGADPNPFIAVDLPGIRPEIFAYGFRNPQRMSWDVPTNTAIIADIGLASWEELNVLRKGGNYGYPHREGPEQLWIGGPNDRKTGSQATPPTPFPDPDVLSVVGLDAPVIPLYPVAVYSHQDGDAVAGGFVYRGARLIELYGKYVFGDITTARLLYADLADMLGADDDDPATLATVKELQVFFDTPHDSPNRGLEITRLFDAAAAEYAARGGTPTDGGVLPDAAKHLSDGLDADGVAYGGGRADIRFALDRDGELYVLSKSDGMIRSFTGSLLHPSSMPESFTITVTTDGGGGGAVTSAPRGLNCSGTCSAAFRAGSAVTLVATPDPVSAFSGWAGACSGTSACMVTAGASVVATFVDSAADMVAVVSSIPPAAAPGVLIAVAETTSNAGGAAAVSSTTRYYLSADAVKNDGDLALKTRSVTSLASGTSSSTTTSLTLPTSTPLGNYYLLACADDTFRVPERQEGNNCGASAGPLTVAKPDLSAVVVADPPAGIAPGTSFTATDTVENRGGYLAGKSTTRYFLSQDTTKGPGDQLLTGTRSVASLAPNASSTGSKTVTVPAATSLGMYWLLACADDAAKVVELDESNNCVASSSRVLVGRPDLVQLSVSDPPGEAPASLSFSVTDLVRNDGTVATVKTSTRYYLSLDGSKGADDLLLGQSRSIGVLAAGASSAGSKGVKLPVGLPPGAYYLLACADDAAKMAELREDNNCVASANVLIKR